MLFQEELLKQAEMLVKQASKRSVRLATAESCTGGLIAALITEISGASEVFDAGFVTYSNRAKIEQLTVPSYFISDYGAVSRETAIAMAEGLQLVTRADVTLSVTGIAGPGGGSDEKPVGTVYMAVANRRAKTIDKHFTFSGNREQIRLLSVGVAIELMTKALAAFK